MWIQTNINLSNFKYHISNCMKGKNYVFGGNNSALTSNHSPKEGERDQDLFLTFLDIFLSLQKTI